MGNKNKGKKGGFFRSTPAETIRIPKLNPQQQALQDNAIANTLSRLNNVSLPGNQLTSSFDFTPIAQSATANFHQNTVPSIAERFTSMGSSANALSSPSFVQQLGQSGAGLEAELARLGAEYGLQKQALEQSERGQQTANLFNLLGAGLTPNAENIYQPEKASGLMRLLKGAGQGALQLGTAALAGGGLSGLFGGGGNNASAPVSAGGTSTGFSAPNIGWNGGQFGYGNNYIPLGTRSAGISALNNYNSQFNNPAIPGSRAQSGYADVIRSLHGFSV